MKAVDGPGGQEAERLGIALLCPDHEVALHLLLSPDAALCDVHPHEPR